MQIFNKQIKFVFSIKIKLIEHSLHQVHKYGWHQNAILAACATLDLSPASHKLITPYDLIAHSMNQWNNNAIKIIHDNNFNNQKRIRQKIRYAIRTRLEQQIPYIDTWAQAMRIGAQPSNISRTTKLLWSYSDQIWHRCGDKSTDYNHYSKRILFNTAYASTQIFLLTDQSTDKFATWDFLQRRLQDIETLGKNISNAKTVADALGNGVLSLLTMFKQPQRFQHPIEKAEPKLHSNEIKQKQVKESH